MLYGPKVIQAAIATVFDVCTWRFAKRLLGKSIDSRPVLILSLISAFNFAYLPRTISNATEAALTAAALWLWPLVPAQGVDWRRLLPALLLVGWSCLVKPSAALHWLFPAFHLLWYSRPTDRPRIIITASAAAGLTILIGGLIDGYFYGEDRMVFTWWRFFKANFSSNVALLYGSMPWHFYLSQGLPFMAGTMLPLLLLGMVLSGSGWPSCFLVSSISLLSCLGHKEFRFLFQAMPAILTLSGVGVHASVKAYGGDKKRQILLGAVLVISNLAAGLYLARWHLAGPVPAIDWLRTQVDEHPGTQALFLTPCHATPYYGYLHRDIPMRFLTCSLPINHATNELVFESGYVDEADQFYADPPRHLRQHPDLLAGKTHVFCYQALIETWPQVSPILEDYGFVLAEAFFNGHFSPDSRRSGHLLAYTKSL